MEIRVFLRKDFIALLCKRRIRFPYALYKFTLYFIYFTNDAPLKPPHPLEKWIPWPPLSTSRRVISGRVARFRSYAHVFSALEKSFRLSTSVNVNKVDLFVVNLYDVTSRDVARARPSAGVYEALDMKSTATSCCLLIGYSDVGYIHVAETCIKIGAALPIGIWIRGANFFWAPVRHHGSPVRYPFPAAADSGSNRSISVCWHGDIELTRFV